VFIQVLGWPSWWPAGGGVAVNMSGSPVTLLAVILSGSLLVIGLNTRRRGPDPRSNHLHTV